MDVPVFRAPSDVKKEGLDTSIKRLPLNTYHTWLKRLGVEVGFAQTLRTYCLRRGNGNAINGRLRYVCGNALALTSNLR